MPRQAWATVGSSSSAKTGDKIEVSKQLSCASSNQELSNYTTGSHKTSTAIPQNS